MLDDAEMPIDGVFGVAMFDESLRLITWNEAYFYIQDLPPGLARMSRPFEDFVRFWLARQQLPLGEAERRAISVIDEIKSAQPHLNYWKNNDSCDVVTLVAPIYGGGAVSVCCLEESADDDSEATLKKFLSQTKFLSLRAVGCSRIDVLDALDGTTDGFAMFDIDDRLIFCNAKYREFAGDNVSQLLPGTKYATILKTGFDAGEYTAEGQTADSIYKMHKRARRGEIRSYELGLRDGRWLNCSESVTQDGNTISIQSEITDQKEREAELTRLSDALKVQNLHFDTALNNMVQGLCLFDADQRLIVCNKRYLDMYGFSPDVVKPGILLREIMEYSVSLGNYSSDDASEALNNRPEQAAQTEQSMLEQWLKDGRVIGVLHQPMPGGGSVATYEDITERKRSEKRLEEHADELEIRNQELQNFAHIASHDLQEPLRKIEAFGGRLRRKYQDSVGDDGVMYMERMEDAAKRMRQLIEDLLSYSRIRTRGESFEPCDLNKVMENVLSDLEIRLDETGAVIEVCDMPEIHGSEVQMHQLLLNLVSNALKFSREDVAPKVTIAVTTQEIADPEVPGTYHPYLEIEIKDNGIGFEQKYAEQIFGIFQRLHGRTEFEGTGIGLATCLKIAERHGGTIEAFGEPGVGATFKVTLLMKSVSFEQQ